MVLSRHLLSEIFGRFDCTWVDIFIMFIDTEKDAVIVAHLKGRERITACHTRCQDVSFRPCKEVLIK